MSAKSQNSIKNYSDEWKKVSAFINKNLPKSAQEVVYKIYLQAKKDQQDAQIIKTLLYTANLQSENIEDNLQQSIKNWENELNFLKAPSKNILSSYLADLYFKLYQKLRWNLYNRTQTKNYIKTDLNTWDLTDFYTRISNLVQQSIKNEDVLKLQALDPFDEIITKGNMRHLRPTLYDLLAHKALNFLANDELDFKIGTNSFDLNNIDVFAEAKKFIAVNFNSTNKSSGKLIALNIFQKLIEFHINDIKPGALIDVDIERLQYAYQYTTLPNKRNLYLSALNQITEKYKNLPAASQAWYLIANEYSLYAENYTPHGDTSNQYEFIKALQICNQILLQKDSSEGKINCESLLDKIQKTNFQFNIENVNVPNQPYRCLITYKNITALHFRLISSNQTSFNSPIDNLFWSSKIAITPIKKWKQNLPQTNDFQQHSVEIKIDELPIGNYFLIASEKENFSLKDNIIGGQSFIVSNISYINYDHDYFVLNRETGQPLSNAKVEIFEHKFDDIQNQNNYVKNNQYLTDENGHFLLTPLTSNQNFYNSRFKLAIYYQNDSLTNDAGFYYSYPYPKNLDIKNNIPSIFLFTDRSLYRPGQTVFFKGIVFSHDLNNLNHKVLSNYKSSIHLRNSNYQDIDSVRFSTNEYGSFSGKFNLPQTGLNGQFSLTISDINTSVNFHVEEYKRPKFIVNYEPINGTFKLNNQIHVTGNAKAYAGNNIDGAQVIYRVVRIPRFIYNWYWRGRFPQIQEVEIAQGQTKTDAKGKFEVYFIALPDATIDKNFDPVFDYKIFADVTDINGETRSAETLISVSYKSLILKTNLSNRINVDSFKQISIITENLNGHFESAKVNIIVSPLISENRLIRPRYWQRPDLFIFSKEEYIKNFPYDEYDNESDFTSWSKNLPVLNLFDTTSKNAAISLKNHLFKPGFYAIEILTNDKDGQEIKEVKYVELYDDKLTVPTNKNYVWQLQNNISVEPGEKAIIPIGTSASQVFLIEKIETDLKNKNENFNFKQLNNEILKINIPVNENNRGGIGISYAFVKHNRIFSFSNIINVPWSNKDLHIEYLVSRDKTLPGSKEKWVIKISGLHKEKIATELLTTMYDASLDQFYPHNWQIPAIWPNYYPLYKWNANENFSNIESEEFNSYSEKNYTIFKNYDFLNSFMNTHLRGNRSLPMLNEKVSGLYVTQEAMSITPNMNSNKKYKSESENLNDSTQKISTIVNNSSIQPRKNFNETAFFLPELKTDSVGKIEINFTTPEALTRWKFLAFAHSKDAAFGYSTKELVTQKELMLQPNAPRFLREGDKIEFNTKLINLSDKEITGTIQLELINSENGQSVDGWLLNMQSNQYFTLAAGQSQAIFFPIEIPYGYYSPLTWRLTAKTNENSGIIYSDAEENIIPILNNSILVTESMPINLQGSNTKNFRFEKLIHSNEQSTIQNKGLTVEYTTNPVWYAIQALPYMENYPYDCAEQNWNRYFTNSLAEFILNSSPKIKEVFNKWKTIDTAALLSNLYKNQELKNLLLEETPWVLNAKNENEQKKNIALLFDLNQLSNQLNTSIQKLKQLQSPQGGFAWFKGGPDDRFITQYIISGIGHLKKLGAIQNNQILELKKITDAAIPYLDGQMKKDFEQMNKLSSKTKKINPNYDQIGYLYMRSFFPEYPIPQNDKKAYQFYLNYLNDKWNTYNNYLQGMIALIFYRNNIPIIPKSILKSLKERAIYDEEIGMYWKNEGGWYWYQAPIETQSLLIEAFKEIDNDMKTVDDLKTWLIKNKQTNNWQTTKATAEACYALLLQGNQWIDNTPQIDIKLNQKSILNTTTNHQEAGTGYIKKTIDAKDIIPEMGNISVNLLPSSEKNKQTLNSSWGAIYWQYFENLDHITVAKTPLKLNKKLFIQTNSEIGPILTPINEETLLQVGNKITVRIELQVDRDMEYVQMKDLRASCLEPVDVLSNYKWQGGLGYYQTTKDASTNFFFSFMKKGTYVFEYTLFVTHKGNFSNGITTIQCMYAPEFSSHSEGTRIRVTQ